MIITNNLLIFPKERISQIPENKSKIGIAYIFYLPFRLEIGKIAEFDCSFGKKTIDIWVYNEIVSIPENSKDLLELLRPDHKLERFTSKLMIHFKNPIIENEDFEKIITWVQTKEVQSTNLSKNIFHASIALNRLLVSCNAVSPHMIVGEIFKKISYSDLITTYAVSENIIISDEDFPISTEEAEILLSSLPIQNMGLDRWSGNSKMSGELNQEAQECLTRYLDKMLFYELLYEAKSKAKIVDWRGALIQAAMALENAIWLIMEYCIYDKFMEVKSSLKYEPEKMVLTDTYIGEIINNFGRKLGIHLLIQILPYLFFNENEMIKPTVIKKAVSAIETRNKLIHSKKTKSDNYHWSELESKDLMNHFSTLYNLTIELAPFIKKKIDERDNEEVGDNNT